MVLRAFLKLPVRLQFFAYLAMLNAHYSGASLDYLAAGNYETFWCVMGLVNGFLAITFIAIFRRELEEHYQ